MNARFEPRKARYTPIVVSHDDWPWPELLVATDISPRGLFVASDRLVAEGEELRLSFRLGTQRLFEVDGCVVRSLWRRRRGDPGFSGFGIELAGVSPLERIAMRSLLRSEHSSPTSSFLSLGEASLRTNRRRKERWGGRRREDRPRPTTHGILNKRLFSSQTMSRIGASQQSSNWQKTKGGVATFW